MGIICSQPTTIDELRKTSDDETHPSFMIFVPSKKFQQKMKNWSPDVLYIPANAMTQLSLNLTASESLHLVVNRDEVFDSAVNLFLHHVGSESIRFVRRSARYEATRSAFEQLPVS